MNKKEFDVLRFISENKGNISQRIIAENTNVSLGSINRIIREFRGKGLVNESLGITVRGIELLEPYTVENAIILAAGMSTRFIPISYELPKGLISVKGEVLVERLIRQLHEARVMEVIVVVGYKMEKFFYLRDKYNVKLVVNNEYSTRNTHSSIFAARDSLKNTYILCSDNYYPQNMFHKYEYRSTYCAVYQPGISYTERGFQFAKGDYVVGTKKPAVDQWIMYGHAYLNREFNSIYIPILEDYYNRPGVEQMYWETIYAENVDKLPMWGMKCSSEQILEFDNMSELNQFDPEFIAHNRVKVFENICRVLCCELTDISEIEPIKNGLNNRSFKFKCKENYYIYRHPGINASNVVNRKKEAESLRTAKKLGIDDTLIHIDENEGWKISRFIQITDNFDFSNKKHIDMLADKLKKLHMSKASVGFGFDYEIECEKIIGILRYVDAMEYRCAIDEKNKMQPIFEFLKMDKWQVSLCHNDLYEPNLLVEKEKLHIIDWEFAGDTDIGFDVCKLFAVYDTSCENIDYWVDKYFGRETTNSEKKHMIACAAVIYYYWYIWGIYAVKNNQSVSDYLIKWYDKMNCYRNMFNKMSIEREVN